MRSPLVWRSPHSPLGRVLIEAHPLQVMDAYLQNKPSKPEAGGILLGFRRGVHLHVTIATPPQLADKGTRFQFVRSSQRHQELASEGWRAQGETMDYLGEWHTHPEQYPMPSITDLREWRKIGAKKVTPMLFAIMGWSGTLWLGMSNRSTIAPCAQYLSAPEERP